MMIKEEREAIQNPIRYYTNGEPYLLLGGAELRDHPIVLKLAEYDRHEKYILPELIVERDQWKAQAEVNAAAKRTLELKGYTYHGGELWKPPLGKKTDFNLVDRYKAQVETLKSVMRDSENPCEFCKYSRDDNTPDNVCDDREDDNLCLECMENGGDTEYWQFDEARFLGGGEQ